MADLSFADVVYQSITFSSKKRNQQLVLDLLDTEWVQRLREISQTANTRLVYMFAEHSRFGHSLGVAYAACELLEKLARFHPAEVREYECAISAAALLHDIGHLAPGSHTAQKVWFPTQPDQHEEISVKIVLQDPELRKVLERVEPKLPEQVAAILSSSPDLPPWTWEIVSGGGWNVDRGNWCIVDSVLAGVSYGKYNIPALTDSIRISANGHLAVRENRLDAMMHFAVSRHAMYRQVYQHRVLLAADMIMRALAARARDLGDKLEFADDAMREVLSSTQVTDLTLPTIFSMREPWWRYHLMQWTRSSDPVLSDLAVRLIGRRLLKTIRIRAAGEQAALLQEARKAVEAAGFDPKYYLHELTTSDVHAGDSQQSMLVLLDDGTTIPLHDADPLFQTLVSESKQTGKSWIALPEEAKALIGRDR